STIFYRTDYSESSFRPLMISYQLECYQKKIAGLKTCYLLLFLQNQMFRILLLLFSLFP
ncbi:hypothetical protein PCS81218_01240, partial [Streptococcus pneumoniae PCS81218]